MKYRNPIIPGFHPDPSLCRVGEDFFLVTSSFEYFPGVPLFHSRDLVHWIQIGHCLTRPSQLPLERMKSSGGIYAPTIRHHRGRFYMVTTNMTGGGNFYVHTDDPFGEWSDPIWMEQGGIDPSLFFDEDGKVYFTSNGSPSNKMSLESPRGVYQSEIEIETGRQLTETKFLWPGTGGSFPEAPHLFKKDGTYYLLISEGGTEYGHMVTIARSHSPWGPFESCPANPILTHRSLPESLQCTGHADFVEDTHGNWWAVFLAVRPVQYCLHVLGRETCLAPVSWSAEGWPVIHGGNPVPLDVEIRLDQEFKPFSIPYESDRETFDAPTFRPCWSFLRNPHPEDFTLGRSLGGLRIRCSGITLDEVDSPAFIARRQLHIQCEASTLVEFMPGSEEEEAGLVIYRSPGHHARLAVTWRQGKRVVIFHQRIGPLSGELACVAAPEGPVTLGLRSDRTHYHLFLLQPDGQRQSLFSTEIRYFCSEVTGGFTGVTLGLFASGSKTTPADQCNHVIFRWFDYKGLPDTTL